MSWARRVDDSVHEADLRAEARSEALRALHRYRSPLNSQITRDQLAAMRDSDVPEGAGTPGDLPSREQDPNAA